MLKSILVDIATVIFLVFVGMLFAIYAERKDCISGKLNIYDGKIYRCVEVKT